MRVPGARPDPPRRRGRRAAILLAALGVELVSIRRSSGRFGGETVVRCASGHLFTTIWVPGVSLKSLRLGPRRYQRCPVGRHWTWVRPVRESSLSAEGLQAAHDHHDIRIP